jgi:hypothetical protein
MIKKILIAGAVFALFTFSPSVSAQTPGGTRFGIKAGVSISTLDGVINANPQTRAGLVTGPIIRFKPSNQGFAVQAEALFSSQGANLKTSTGTEKYDSYYLNVPVLLRQYIGKIFYVNVGPQAGLFLGSGRANLKGADIAVVGGLGLETRGGFVFDARLNYGFSDINNDPDEERFRKQLGIGGLHNRAVQLSIGYLFGKKK